MTKDDQIVHDDKCPLEPIDRRLSDLHRQWHSAEQSYFDPDEFRIAIQTCIQTARTVTFILQSNKALFSDFDAWYAPWQTEFRNIPLMKWMVDARNKIEKRGDLETHSQMTVSILASYLEKEKVTVNVEGELFDSTEELLAQIPRYAFEEHVSRNGIMQIERCWVANDLPDFELLDAVGVTYGHLSRLVHSAHLALGLSEPNIMSTERGTKYDHEAMDGRMPCMIGHDRTRIFNVWLETGEPLEIETAATSVSLEQAEAASERYDFDPKDIYGDAESSEDLLQNLFDTARSMFLTDDHHITIAFLLKGQTPVDMVEWRPDEHGHKYVMAQMLADQVQRVGADAVIMIGEIWMAPYEPEKPFARAFDSPDRIEALVGTLVSKDGDPVRLFAEILRGVDAAGLKSTDTETEIVAPYLFAPVYKVWGRELVDQSEV